MDADAPWYFEPEAEPLRLRQLAWRHVRSDPKWHDILLQFAEHVEAARARWLATQEPIP